MKDVFDDDFAVQKVPMFQCYMWMRCWPIAVAAALLTLLIAYLAGSPGAAPQPQISTNNDFRRSVYMRSFSFTRSLSSLSFWRACTLAIR